MHPLSLIISAIAVVASPPIAWLVVAAIFLPSPPNGGQRR